MRKRKGLYFNFLYTCYGGVQLRDELKCIGNPADSCCSFRYIAPVRQKNKVPLISLRLLSIVSSA
ncbi:hypothetical protein ACSX1A_18270 [Pontibacter sp. MBLB2868]|uniref:hypothetical protein n=1 Tax=Pontibacter sp. MBLB2868 TaxID=3451555 RepID=UPI003F75183F